MESLTCQAEEFQFGPQEGNKEPPQVLEQRSGSTKAVFVLLFVYVGGQIDSGEKPYKHLYLGCMRQKQQYCQVKANLCCYRNLEKQSATTASFSASLSGKRQVTEDWELGCLIFTIYTFFNYLWLMWGHSNGYFSR